MHLRRSPEGVQEMSSIYILEVSGSGLVHAQVQFPHCSVWQKMGLVSARMQVVVKNILRGLDAPSWARLSIQNWKNSTGFFFLFLRVLIIFFLKAKFLFSFLSTSFLISESLTWIFLKFFFSPSQYKLYFKAKPFQRTRIPASCIREL